MLAFLIQSLIDFSQQLITLGHILQQGIPGGPSSAQFSSVAQSSPTLCNLMECSTPVFSVHHQLPELTQTHVHRVNDAIQPSHSLSSPSPPTFNLSQHQCLFQKTLLFRGFPDNSIGKEATCNVGDLGLIPGWVGKISWRRERLPTPVFWPGEFHRL